jgi:hypothetical protein
MAEEKPKKEGALARRRERKRLKHEQSGDTPEKRKESAGRSYDERDATARAGLGGMSGGGPGGG